MAESYGAYLAEAGITDRATVIVDSSGTVRHASSVGPAGERSIEELAALCEKIDGEAGTSTQAAPQPQGLGADAVLFVKSHCGFSRRARVAVDNVHAADLAVRNASDDPQALDALRRVSGAETAPCLVLDGSPLAESDAIVRTLAERLAPL
jgi:glutaredoxin